MSGAVIETVRLAAAHDGEAELLVTLRYSNGGRSLVTLDHHAAQALLADCAADAPDALVGIGWEAVRDALQAASGRFATMNG